MYVAPEPRDGDREYTEWILKLGNQLKNFRTIGNIGGFIT